MTHRARARAGEPATEARSLPTAAAGSPGPLVSAAWPRDHLGDSDLLLVHVSPTRRVYNRRHLPGAVFADLHRDLALRGTAPATGDAVREWLLPSRGDVEAALARWGGAEIETHADLPITGPPGSTAEPPTEARGGPGATAEPPTPSSAARAPRVVFYDDVGLNRQAIRGYWLLRLYRFPADRVHVLDGGITAWLAAGGPVTDRATTGAADPPATTELLRGARGRGASAMAPVSIRLGAIDPRLIATTDQVRAWSSEAALPGGPTRILDVRTAEEFVGADGHGARRAGRIPGARNRCFADFLRPDSTIRSVPEILGLVCGSGVEPDEVRAVYCMGGVRAALAWFVLHELAGLDGVHNYAGSWEEWGNRTDVPVESDVVGGAPGAGDDAPAPRPLDGASDRSVAPPVPLP